MEKNRKVRLKSQLTGWRPTKEELEKIEELKKELIIGTNTGLVIKCIGETYNRVFPNRKW